MNCEIRYQLKEKWGFIDSSLLEWAAVRPEHLIEVLKDPRIVFSGEIKEDRDVNMWRCEITGIKFHGKKKPHQLLDADGKADETKIAEEKADTVSRIKYQVEKFVKVASSDASKLYILGIHPHFCRYKGEQLKTFVENVYKTLEEIAVNASLLVIVSAENADAVCILDNDKNLFVRTIKNFAPYNSATNPNYANLEEGGKLFSEFSPKIIKEDNKTYKFEQTHRVSSITVFIWQTKQLFYFALSFLFWGKLRRIFTSKTKKYKDKLNAIKQI